MRWHGKVNRDCLQRFLFLLYSFLLFFLVLSLCVWLKTITECHLIGLLSNEYTLDGFRFFVFVVVNFNLNIKTMEKENVCVCLFFFCDFEIYNVKCDRFGSISNQIINTNFYFIAYFNSSYLWSYSFDMCIFM